MSFREPIRKKNFSPLSRTSASNPLQRRRFKVPKPQKPVVKRSPEEQKAFWQQKLEQSAFVGYNGLDVPVNVPKTPPPQPVQQQSANAGLDNDSKQPDVSEAEATESQDKETVQRKEVSEEELSQNPEAPDTEVEEENVTPPVQSEAGSEKNQSQKPDLQAQRDRVSRLSSNLLNIPVNTQGKESPQVQRKVLQNGLEQYHPKIEQRTHPVFNGLNRLNEMPLSQPETVQSEETTTEEEGNQQSEGAILGNQSLPDARAQPSSGVLQSKLIDNKQENPFEQKEGELEPVEVKKQLEEIPAISSNKNPLSTPMETAESPTQTLEKGQSKEKPPAPQGDQSEAKQSISKVDRGELEQKKNEVLAEKQPEIDQANQQLSQGEQAAQQASAEVDKPAEPIVESQPEKPPQQSKAEAGAATVAQEAASKAEQAFNVADSQSLPEPPAQAAPPTPVIPVATGGMPVPGNPEADAQISNLAQQAQSLRQGGNQLLAQAAQVRANAAILRGNMQLVKQGVSQAEQGVATSTEHLQFRQQAVGQAKNALNVSEDKAAKVTQEAPGFADKASEGQEKTQPMASEANELAGENAAKTPDDPEAAGKAQEQGQKLNQVGSDTTTLDDAFTQTKAKAESLTAEATQATAINTQTNTNIQTMEQTLGQTQERLSQMKQQNAQANSQVASVENQPDEMLNQATELEQKGQALIQAATEIEQQLQQIQADYQQAMSNLPAPEAASGGSESGTEAGIIQRDVEEGRYEDRINLDLVGSVSESASWLTGVDPATEEQQQQAIQAAEARRQEQIAQINARAGGDFENLSAGQKVGIALELMGQNISSSLSNIQWPNWQNLAVSLIDPRGPLTGVLGGLSQIISGGANLFSAEQWAKDPLGNFLKSAADIATGLTVILGSITALAGVIIAICSAATILTLGLAAPATGPIIAFCATIMTTVGGWTLVAGLVAAGLQSLVLIKNLVDAATAQTAEDLQNQSDQMTQDVSNTGNALLQAGMGKLAQVGGRQLQSGIAQAGGGQAFARAMPSRLATGVRQGVQGVKTLPSRVASGAQKGVQGVKTLPSRVASGVQKGWQRFKAFGNRLPENSEPPDALLGPKGPGQFQIKNFSGPISPEEARLGAILESNPQVKAAGGLQAAQLSPDEIAQAARYVQADKQAAILIHERGLPGLKGLVKANGDAEQALKFLFEDELATFKPSLPRKYQRKNVAIGELKIDNPGHVQVKKYEPSVSGRKRIPGTLEGTGEYAEHTRPVNQPPHHSGLRDVDSEIKIFENARKDLQEISNPQGRLIIYTENEPCPSCTEFIYEKQIFQREFPGIDVKVIYTEPGPPKPIKGLLGVPTE